MFLTVEANPGMKAVWSPHMNIIMVLLFHIIISIGVYSCMDALTQIAMVLLRHVCHT